MGIFDIKCPFYIAFKLQAHVKLQHPYKLAATLDQQLFGPL
jgi:hypothetical protein